MKLFILLVLLALVIGYHDFSQEAGQRFETWDIAGTAQEIAHFCHLHTPASPLETVIVHAGNQTIELSG